MKIYDQSKRTKYGNCIMLLKDSDQLLLYAQLSGTSFVMLYLMKRNSMLAIMKESITVKSGLRERETATPACSINMTGAHVALYQGVSVLL